MQELVFHGANELRWCDQAPPTLQSDADVLVRPIVVAGCDLDRQIARGQAPFAPPFTMGHEFVAEIVDVSKSRSWTVGETVAVAYQPSCGSCLMCRRGSTNACKNVPATSMYGIGPAGGDWGGALSDCVRVPFADAMLCRLPSGVSALQAANASDNLMDAYRCVAPQLAEIPGGSVLIAGSGGISLMVVDCARRLGAERISYYSQDQLHLEQAEKLGAEIFEITSWPKRFPSHDITVNCTNDEAGLYALISSTGANGFCTSPSIYFRDVSLPMTRMYMKGITLCLGRTNGAGDLPKMLELIASEAIDPLAIEPLVVPWNDVGDALLSDAPKVIAERAPLGKS